MAAFISENTQFVDESGTPIVNGKIYIGLVGTDPVVNPIVIFADRELTIILENPQLTDADGRSLNKIWIPERYSIVVRNSNNVQKYIDIDAGATPQSGVTTLTNIQSFNDIIAEASTTIISLVDKEIYAFKAIANNTGPVTLAIDSIFPKAVIKYDNTPLVSNDILQDKNIFVEYNDFFDNFKMMSVLPLLSQGTLGQGLLSTGNDAAWGFVNPVASILAWTTNLVPLGFLECDGSVISRTTFATLFLELGTIYGDGDGTTTFNIPDLRGEFIRGYDNSASIDPDAGTRTDSGGGITGNNVGTKQADEIISHDHEQETYDLIEQFTSGVNASARITIVGGSTPTGMTGGAETRPRNVYMMYVIKF